MRCESINPGRPGLSFIFALVFVFALSGQPLNERRPRPLQRSVDSLIVVPGDLDPSFGSGGKVITDVNVQRNQGGASAIQADGKIVQCGTVGGVGLTDFLLVRYNIDGTRDSSFGSDGIATGDNNGLVDAPNAIAVQSDGKIVAFGQSRTDQTPITYYLLAMRFNSDGTLDSSFGTGGKAAISLGNFPQFGLSVLIQPDGKIVGAAQARDQSNLPAMGAVRFNTDGTMDNGFGTGGTVIVPFGGTDVGAAASVNRQPDGKLVLAGVTDRPNTFRDFALARLNTDGSLDNTFGTDGKVVTDLDRSDNFGDAALQRDGKIVVVGTSNVNIELSLARYNSDGTLDTTFGNGGKIVSIPTAGENFGSAVAVQPDGKVLAAASCGVFPDRDFCVLRYGVNGTIDNSFGMNGMVRTGLSSNSLDNPHEMFLQRDGKVIVSGDTFTDTPTSWDIAVVRYLNDSFTAPPRALFDYDGDGRADISVFRPSSGAWYLQQSTAGLYGAEFGYSTDKITPADYDGDGKTDIAVYRPETGIWYVFRSSDGTVEYHVFGIAEDLPTPADYDGDGLADVSVFRPSTATWYRQNSSDGSFYAVQFGLSEDKPTIGDFDGDGRSDIAIFRPSDGAWYQLYSSDGSLHGAQFGFGTDIIVPADYDGDGHCDIAVFRPSTGLWYIFSSSNGQVVYAVFGLPDDIPAPGDFDGDGKADVSVFRPSDGTWYRTNSSDGSFYAYPFGTAGDRPTQTAFRY